MKINRIGEFMAEKGQVTLGYRIKRFIRTIYIKNSHSHSIDLI